MMVIELHRLMLRRSEWVAGRPAVGERSRATVAAVVAPTVLRLGFAWALARALDSEGFNQLLKAQTECGLLVTSISSLDLGTGLVPPAVERTFSRTTGSLQRWVEGGDV